MIANTPNIDQYINRERLSGIYFNKLRVNFKAKSLKHIKELGHILESDGISYTIRRMYFRKWELTIEIPVIDKYSEDEYMKIMGKLLLLASRCFVEYSGSGLIG